MHINPGYEFIEKSIFAYIVLNNNISDITEFIEIYKKTVENIDYQILESVKLTFEPKNDINQPYVSRRFQRYNIRKNNGKYIIEDINWGSVIRILKDKLKKEYAIPHEIISLHSECDNRPFLEEGLYILPLSVSFGSERKVAKIIYDVLSTETKHAFTAIIPGMCSVLIIARYNYNISILNVIFGKLCNDNGIEFETMYISDDYEESDSSNAEYEPYTLFVYAALGDKESLEEYKELKKSLEFEILFGVDEWLNG